MKNQFGQFAVAVVVVTLSLLFWASRAMGQNTDLPPETPIRKTTPLPLTTPSLPSGMEADLQRIELAVEAYERLNLINVKYDKFKDETTASFVINDVMPYFQALFSYSGTKLKRNAQSFYFFFSGDRCYGFCFHSPSLIFLIDGKRVSLQDRPTLSNSVSFVINRALLSRIAAAKEVEYQVGSYEAKWKGKDLEKFKSLLELATVRTLPKTSSSRIVKRLLP